MTGTSQALRGRSSGIRRSLFGIAGQLLNAGTNVATAFIASYLLRPAEFGLFVLAFACVTMVLATGRGLIGATLLSHLPAQAEERRPALVGSAIGFTVCAGVIATVVIGLIAFALPALVYFVPWVLLALVQDSCRHVFLSVGRSGSALLLDVAWAVAQFLFIAVWLLVAGPLTLGVASTAWGVGALAGVVAFAVLSRDRPTAPGLWTRTTRDVAGWFTATAIIGQSEVYLVLLLAGTLLAPAEAGGLRAVQLLAFQPATVLLGSILVLSTPAFARLPDDVPTAVLLRTAVKALTATLPVIVLMLAIVPLRLPIMGLVLPQYLGFEALVLPVALQSVTSALSLPGVALLRGRRRGALVFGLQTTRLVLVLTFSLVGLAGIGVLGVAWALTAGGAIGFVNTSVVAWRAVRGNAGGLPAPAATGA